MKLRGGQLTQAGQTGLFPPQFCFLSDAWHPLFSIPGNNVAFLHLYHREFPNDGSSIGSQVYAEEKELFFLRFGPVVRELLQIFVLCYTF